MCGKFLEEKGCARTKWLAKLRSKCLYLEPFIHIYQLRRTLYVLYRIIMWTQCEEFEQKGEK